MSDQYVPALRQRFLEDMQIKGLQSKTQTMYLRAMRDFTRFLGHAPDSAPPEELRAFQLDMKERGVGVPTFNNRLTVLSFFFAATCPRPEMKRHMRYQRAAKKIPVVLSAEEVARIIEAAPWARSAILRSLQCSLRRRVARQRGHAPEGWRY
jgi:site-specific recombinase XerD